MATGWTPVTSGSGGGGEIQGGVDKAGADGFFEPVRASLIADAHAVFPLGGSRQTSVIKNTYQDAIDYIDFEVTSAAYAGFTYTAEIDVITADAGTSITPKIIEVGGPDAVIGSTSTSTTWARQSLSFTPTVGKRYRLQLIKGNDSANAYGIGFIQRTA
jgi:hypothetical protein